MRNRDLSSILNILLRLGKTLRSCRYLYNFQKRRRAYNAPQSRYLRTQTPLLASPRGQISEVEMHGNEKAACYMSKSTEASLRYYRVKTGALVKLRSKRTFTGPYGMEYLVSSWAWHPKREKYFHKNCYLFSYVLRIRSRQRLFIYSVQLKLGRAAKATPQGKSPVT